MKIRVTGVQYAGVLTIGKVYDCNTPELIKAYNNNYNNNFRLGRKAPDEVYAFIDDQGRINGLNKAYCNNNQYSWKFEVIGCGICGAPEGAACTPECDGDTTPDHKVKPHPQSSIDHYARHAMVLIACGVEKPLLSIKNHKLQSPTIADTTLDILDVDLLADSTDER